MYVEWIGQVLVVLDDPPLAKETERLNERLSDIGPVRQAAMSTVESAQRVDENEHRS